MFKQKKITQNIARSLSLILFTGYFASTLNHQASASTITSTSSSCFIDIRGICIYRTTSTTITQSADQILQQGKPLKKVTLTPQTKGKPKRPKKGRFQSFTDISNTFTISTEVDANDIESLILTPNIPIEIPGSYGNIDFTFVSEFTNTEDLLGSFDFIIEGTLAQETVNVPVPCPEPSTALSLLTLSALGVCTTFRHKFKLSKSLMNKNAKISSTT